MKKLSELTEEEEIIYEIFGHLDQIIETCDHMTSGNFMHNKNACRFSAMVIKDRLEAIGLKKIEVE